MPSMDELRTRILAGELTNNEESLNKALLSFASYRDIAKGRHIAYQKMCEVLNTPGCTNSSIWKTAYHMVLDVIKKERDTEGTGKFEACRDVISQWGGTGDDVITMIRLAGIAENCHESWRLYLQNASFLESEQLIEE